MNIILLAPPAAGKGTQSAFITSKYHLKHISTGDLLRCALAKNDEMSSYIQNEMNAGRLVSDEIILELIKNELVDESYDGVVLDGFPRNLIQAMKYEELLTDLNQTLNCVLYLSIDKEIAEKRIVGRHTCPNCKRIYNSMVEGQKSLEEGICDDCKISLTQRSDDNQQTFDVRYDTYMKETSPLINFYSEKGLLKTLDASKDPNEVFLEIQKILDSIL